MPRPAHGGGTEPTPPPTSARTPHGTRAHRHESRSAHTAAAAAAATEQRRHHARERRPARRAHRTRLQSIAASSGAAELQTPDAAHERRRTTTKRCCVPSRAQSRRRRSMGHGEVNLVSAPRQRGPVARAGGFLFPPMRAWLEQPHGRHHKAPPQPCALTTKGVETKIPTNLITATKTRRSHTPRKQHK